MAAQPRIIAGIYTWRAGIQIKLQPGWKTFWREVAEDPDPLKKWELPGGDYTVPPVFDFTESENIKSIAARWPEPQRFGDAKYYAYGYTGGVVWPLHVVPLDRLKPVKLRLKFDYAVCDVLCVPAKAHVELVFSPRDGAAFEKIVAAAEARVKDAR